MIKLSAEHLLSNEEGCLALEAILQQPCARIVVTKRATSLEQSQTVQTNQVNHVETQKTGSDQDVSDQVKLIWCDVLGVTEITLNSDFFELGGDSLSAIQLTYKLNKYFGVNLSPDSLLDYSSFDTFMEYFNGNN